MEISVEHAIAGADLIRSLDALLSMHHFVTTTFALG
jgi:hypothetical protein